MNKASPGAGSGASTAGLSRVHSRYANDYANRTLADADALRNELPSLKASLRIAWERELTGETASDILKGLQPHVEADAEEVATALRLLERAAQEPEAQRAARTSDGIIEALRGVKRFRTRLVLSIERQSDLVSPYRVKLQDLVSQVSAKQRELNESSKRLGEAAAEEASQRRALAAESDSAVRQQIQIKVDAAAESAAAAKAQVTKLEGELAELKKSEAGARTTLDEAVRNRRVAAESAGRILDTLVVDVSGRRIDAAKQFRTAINFIGEAATEK